MSLKLTLAAADKIKELLKEKQSSETTGGLRLGIRGGSCAGFEYTVDIADKPSLFDIVSEEFGASVFCDKKSYLFLNGTVIDYQKNLMSQGFVFSNPNSKGSCGCGKSFDI